MFGMGYEAEKLERILARVLELVPLIRRSVDHVVRFKRRLFFAIGNHSLSFKDEDFVLPRVRVKRTVTFRRNFEEAHGEVWGAHVFRDEPADRDVGGAAFSDGFGFDGFVVEHFHDLSPFQLYLARVS